MTMTEWLDHDKPVFFDRLFGVVIVSEETGLGIRCTGTLCLRNLATAKAIPLLWESWEREAKSIW